MAIICTDGACKRNGKPDCTSGYGVVAYSNDGTFANQWSGGEYNSTSQRGELLGIIKALEVGLEIAVDFDESIFIVTDSAYLAKGINSKWYEKWERNGWVTSEESTVKNKDLWMAIAKLVRSYPADSLFVYQVKGHINTAIESQMLDAYKRFEENNFGVTPPLSVFTIMLVGNNYADKLATKAAAEYDSQLPKEEK